MVAYLKAGPQVRTYSDYLRAAWEVEKEDSMELPRGPRDQTTKQCSKSVCYQFLPLVETQGQSAYLENTSSALGTSGGTGYQER